MTEYEHRTWLRVADASKRGRWYAPRSTAEARTLVDLWKRGYFGDGRRRWRRSGRLVRRSTFRLIGLWPARGATRIHPECEPLAPLLSE